MSIVENPASPVEYLRVSAPAKINLHLEVLGLRPDGFHELAMVMQSIDLADLLEMRKTQDGVISLCCDDSTLSTDKDNLIIRAADLLRSRLGVKDLGVAIRLEKKIPIGAGLAGGSSDGAATLIGLNSLWNLKLTSIQLEKFAAELGSDMPFCLAGGTQLCFGRGERLEPINSDTSKVSMAILLVKDPSISVSTPWAYARCRELNASRYLKCENDFEHRRNELRKESWLNPLRASDPPSLRNDLQSVVASATPSVRNALKLLADLPGALSFGMSGSGPSCFALYSDYENALLDLESSRNIFENEGFQTWCCPLRFKGVMLYS